MAPSSRHRYFIKASTVVADVASVCCALGFVALILMNSANETLIRGRRPSSLVEPPCNEIYIVGEGETLHTISEKCGDPYIVERNPHIHDPDDVFPGLVIKIVPPPSRR